MAFTLISLSWFATIIMAAGFDINDVSSINIAHKATAAKLMSYYQPNDKGTIPPVESEDENGFQWFEMGIYWGAIMEYTNTSSDKQYFNLAGAALSNASFGGNLSFIGGKVNGKWSDNMHWNDDILWWGFGVIQGAEIEGVESKMQNGLKYLDLAKNTFDQVFSQWDDQCGGGVYWARNRNDEKQNRRLYKSTISNVQTIILGVRLYLLTSDSQYLDAATRIYTWLKGPSGIVTPDGKVYDGVYARFCDKVEKKEFSYNSGLFLGSAALLFNATKNPDFIKDASVVFSNFQNVFTMNNTVFDPCEVSGTCKKNQPQFKGVAIRFLRYYYQISADIEIRKNISKIIQTSAASLSSTCNEEGLCSNFWLPQTSDRPRNVHNQINALELLNALVVIKRGYLYEFMNFLKKYSTTTERSASSASSMYLQAISWAWVLLLLV